MDQNTLAPVTMGEAKHHWKTFVQKTVDRNTLALAQFGVKWSMDKGAPRLQLGDRVAGATIWFRRAPNGKVYATEPAWGAHA